MNEKTRHIFNCLNELPEGTVVGLVDHISGKRIQDDIDNVYQWAVNMNNKAECDFEMF